MPISLNDVLVSHSYIERLLLHNRFVRNFQRAQVSIHLHLNEWCANLWSARTLDTRSCSSLYAVFCKTHTTHENNRSFCIWMSTTNLSKDNNKHISICRNAEQSQSQNNAIEITPRLFSKHVAETLFMFCFVLCITTRALEWLKVWRQFWPSALNLS